MQDNPTMVYKEKKGVDRNQLPCIEYVLALKRKSFF